MPIEPLLANALEKLQSYSVIETQQAAVSVNDLKHKCEIHAFKRAHETLQCLLNNPTLETLQAAWLDYRNSIDGTQLDIGFDETTEANTLFLDCFSEICPHASEEMFLACFFAGKIYVEPTVFITRPTQRTIEKHYRLSETPINNPSCDTSSSDQIKTRDNWQIFLRKHCYDGMHLLSLEVFITVNKKFNLAYYPLLQQTYPGLYKAMQSDNACLSEHLAAVSYFFEQSETVRDALTLLKETLLQNGARITGNHDTLHHKNADSVANALRRFMHYLNKFDDSTQARLYAEIETPERVNLRSIIDILAQGTECVEILAGRIEHLFQHKNNERFLTMIPLLTSEQKQEILARLKAKTVETLHRKDRPTAVLAALPKENLEVILAQLPIPSFETLMELVRVLNTKENCQLLFKTARTAGIVTHYLNTSENLKLVFSSLRGSIAFNFIEAIPAAYWQQHIRSTYSAISLLTSQSDAKKRQAVFQAINHANILGLITNNIRELRTFCNRLNETEVAIIFQIEKLQTVLLKALFQREPCHDPGCSYSFVCKSLMQSYPSILQSVPLATWKKFAPIITSGLKENIPYQTQGGSLTIEIPDAIAKAYFDRLINTVIPRSLWQEIITDSETLLAALALGGTEAHSMILSALHDANRLINPTTDETRSHHDFRISHTCIRALFKIGKETPTLWKSIITNGANLCTLLKHAPSPQDSLNIISELDTIPHAWEELITEGDIFLHIARFKEEAVCIQIIESLSENRKKNILLTLLNTIDLGNIIDDFLLDAAKLGVILKTLPEPIWLTLSTEFIEFLVNNIGDDFRNGEYYKAIVNAAPEALWQMLSPNTTQLITLLSRAPEEVASKIASTVKQQNKLNNIVLTDPQELGSLLKTRLSCDLINALTSKNRWPTLIPDEKTLLIITPCLSDQDRFNAFFDAINQVETWQRTITSASCLFTVFQKLSKAQRAIVFDAINTEQTWQTLINTSNGRLDLLIDKLAIEQRTIVFNAANNDPAIWRNNITSEASWSYCVELLNEEQCRTIFDALSENTHVTFFSLYLDNLINQLANPGFDSTANIRIQQDFFTLFSEAVWLNDTVTAKLKILLLSSFSEKPRTDEYNPIINNIPANCWLKLVDTKTSLIALRENSNETQYATAVNALSEGQFWQTAIHNKQDISDLLSLTPTHDNKNITALLTQAPVTLVINYLKELPADSRSALLRKLIRPETLAIDDVKRIYQQERHNKYHLVKPSLASIAAHAREALHFRKKPSLLRCEVIGDAWDLLIETAVSRPKNASLRTLVACLHECPLPNRNKSHATPAPA